jgi:hypothetical protein
MSIKGFLEAKEMQTGGMLQQSFTGLFANQSRRDPSGAEYIPPTYAPPKPPTIELPPITPLPPTAPTTEEIAQLDPGNVGSHADYNYNVTDAIAGAAKAGMGPFTPAQIGMLEPSLAASLAAYVQPETAVSRTLDATIGQAIPFTPEGRVGYSLAAGTNLLGLSALSSQRGLTGETLTDQVSRASAAVTSLFSDSTPTTTTPLSAADTQFTGRPSNTVPTTPGVQYSKGDKGTPIMTSFYGTPFGADKAAIARAEAASKEAVAAVSTAGVGAEMFDAFGMGGEVSPNFAIGGSGSYTSFGHYGAGISQADEITIGQTGLASGAFASAADGKDTIDTMVSNGYNEAQITAVSKGELDEGELDSLAQAVGMEDAGVSGGDADSVICQELYDQGLLEHSIYSLDEQFGEHIRKHDSDLLEGYHTWAYSVVNAMRKSKTITHIVRIVSRPVVKHIAYKMGYPSKTLLGAVMFNVGAFVCRRLAKKETVYA